MNFSDVANKTEDHQDHGDEPMFWAQIFAAILSLVLGLISAISNILLLLTLHKDPLKCFQRRATTVFIQGLATSDFLAGSFIQTTYALTLLLEATGHKVSVLDNIVSIGSHVGTKISILTLVVLAVDRLLAITLPWKYNTFVTRKRAAATNVFIWISIATFEATHFAPSIEKFLHDIDLHLQTTVPIAGLLIIFIATYLAFRKHSRNAVFAHQSDSRSNRIHMHNLQFEKKIIVTILLIMLVVLASLIPYLIVEKVSEGCDGPHHVHEDDDHAEEESMDCNESKAIARVFSVCLLSLSCALNPILYAWRIPHYRQSLKMVVGVSWRRQDVGVLVPDVPIPSMFRLTDGISHEERDSALARNTLSRSNTNVQYVRPLK
ncbi:adenosine receptor A1-like [Actinia tenebrosa]|uniref:Adenosine receptor A1-like n=1 Tax=Actinia tenebrosa TaxID=6105 RepID=A0A6P8JE29_ACTTE|nr:adenosine receptor A1-like [Actinia tenebrosa]